MKPSLLLFLNISFLCLHKEKTIRIQPSNNFTEPYKQKPKQKSNGNTNKPVIYQPHKSVFYSPREVIRTPKPSDELSQKAHPIMPTFNYKVPDHSLENPVGNTLAQLLRMVPIKGQHKEEVEKVKETALMDMILETMSCNSNIYFCYVQDPDNYASVYLKILAAHSLKLAIENEVKLRASTELKTRGTNDYLLNSYEWFPQCQAKNSNFKNKLEFQFNIFIGLAEELSALSGERTITVDLLQELENRGYISVETIDALVNRFIKGDEDKKEEITKIIKLIQTNVGERRIIFAIPTEKSRLIAPYYRENIDRIILDLRQKGIQTYYIPDTASSEEAHQLRKAFPYITALRLHFLDQPEDPCDHTEIICTLFGNSEIPEDIKVFPERIRQPIEINVDIGDHHGSNCKVNLERLKIVTRHNIRNIRLLQRMNALVKYLILRKDVQLREKLQQLLVNLPITRVFSCPSNREEGTRKPQTDTENFEQLGEPKFEIDNRLLGPGKDIVIADLLKNITSLERVRMEELEDNSSDNDLPIDQRLAIENPISDQVLSFPGPTNLSLMLTPDYPACVMATLEVTHLIGKFIGHQNISWIFDNPLLKISIEEALATDIGPSLFRYKLDEEGESFEPVTIKKNQLVPANKLFNKKTIKIDQLLDSEFGEARLTKEGNILYSPGPNFKGEDQITCLVNDGLDHRELIPVTVTIEAKKGFDSLANSNFKQGILRIALAIRDNPDVIYATIYPEATKGIKQGRIKAGALKIAQKMKKEVINIFGQNDAKLNPLVIDLIRESKKIGIEDIHPETILDVLAIQYRDYTSKGETQSAKLIEHVMFIVNEITKGKDTRYREQFPRATLEAKRFNFIRAYVEIIKQVRSRTNELFGQQNAEGSSPIISPARFQGITNKLIDGLINKHAKVIERKISDNRIDLTVQIIIAEPLSPLTQLIRDSITRSHDPKAGKILLANNAESRITTMLTKEEPFHVQANSKKNVICLAYIVPNTQQCSLANHNRERAQNYPGYKFEAMFSTRCHGIDSKFICELLESHPHLDAQNIGPCGPKGAGVLDIYGFTEDSSHIASDLQSTDTQLTESDQIAEIIFRRTYGAIESLLQIEAKVLFKAKEVLEEADRKTESLEDKIPAKSSSNQAIS